MPLSPRRPQVSVVEFEVEVQGWRVAVEEATVAALTARHMFRV